MNYLLLKSIHGKLQVLTELRSQKDRVPRMIKAAEASEKKMSEEVDAAKKMLLQARKKADEFQMQLASREARIEKMTIQRNGARNNKEFQLLGEQIAADKQANAVLSDEILETLERIDEITAGLELLKSNLAKGQAETIRVKAKGEEQLERLEGELAKVKAELGELEKQLPGSVREEYLLRTRHHGDAALAESDGEVCGGCHSVLSSRTLSDLYAQKEVFCTTCGAMMYFLQRSAG